MVLPCHLFKVGMGPLHPKTIVLGMGPVQVMWVSWTRQVDWERLP